ncbi:MAG TPA: hypothetical protein VMW93_07250 [bacterium]|nr:hypothetical protein [bacterium]
MKKIILAGIAITLLALACGEEEGVTPNVDYRVVSTSPRAVLVNVETAFNRGDLNLLKAMLSENFVFYFDPEDVGQMVPGGIIPETCNYAEFIRTVENLFRLSYSVSMTINTEHVGAPGSGANTFRAEDVDAELIVMMDEVSGYWGESLCDLEFEKYRSKSGAYYWHLTKWWDNANDYGDARARNWPYSIGKIIWQFS